MAGSRVTTRFELDHKGLAAFLMSPQLYEGATEPATEAIRDRTKAIVPKRTGRTADSYEAEEGPIARPAATGVNGNPRRSGVVRSDEQSAVALEFGNKNTEARRPLGRAGAPFHTPLTVRR